MLVYKGVVGRNIDSFSLNSDTKWPIMLYGVSTGCMEDGTTLGDVELPPWAKGDPQEFIRVHREVSDTNITVTVRYTKDLFPRVQIIISFINSCAVYTQKMHCLSMLNKCLL